MNVRLSDGKYCFNVVCYIERNDQLSIFFTCFMFASLYKLECDIAGFTREYEEKMEFRDLDVMLNMGM